MIEELSRRASLKSRRRLQPPQRKRRGKKPPARPCNRSPPCREGRKEGTGLSSTWRDDRFTAEDVQRICGSDRKAAGILGSPTTRLSAKEQGKPLLRFRDLIACHSQLVVEESARQRLASCAAALREKLSLSKPLPNSAFFRRKRYPCGNAAARASSALRPVFLEFETRELTKSGRVIARTGRGATSAGNGA